MMLGVDSDLYVIADAAAFRAGVTPSKIARQFGVSHSVVRKALAGSVSKGAAS